MPNFHPWRARLTTFAVAIVFTFTTSDSYAVFEDPEAIYLNKISGFKPIELKVVRLTAVYANRNRNGYFMNFAQGDKVHLLAYNEKTSLVKHLKSEKTGWVPVENLSEIDPSRIQSAITQLAEQQKYQDAIKNNEVLAGMTLEQVREALGKPDEAAFRSDATGRTDVWSYMEYKNVFRQQTYRDPVTGQLLTRRYKEKVPELETTIEFLNGRVTAIEKKRIQ